MLEFDKYDMLKYELFEQLIPDMLYTGPDEIQQLFLQELENEEENHVYELFCKLCDEDEVPCPYGEHSFSIERFEEGGVQFIEITVPPSSYQINHVLRAYVLIAHERKNPEVKHLRYFIVKKFLEKGMVHVMYISPEGESLLGDELTSHIENRKYEHHAVARNFFMVLLNELHFGGNDAETNIVGQA